MIVYGISNCDTVRKARRWLDDHRIDYHFHDLRRDGLTTAMISGWLKAVAADTLLNRRSTTWKGLDPEVRDNLSEADIPALLESHPTLVKRPVLEDGGRVLVGFSENSYRTFTKS